MLNPCAYRQMISSQGETIRWFQARLSDQYNPATNYDPRTAPALGAEWVERLLSASVKALIFGVKSSFLHPEIGWVRTGDLQCMTMPDEIALGHLDRVVLTQREMIERERVVKGEDTLRHPYPESVVTIYDDDRTYLNATLDTATRVLTWGAGVVPATGATYIVEYKYHPVFWYIGDEQTVPRPSGKDAARLPQKGLLTYKRPGEA